MDNNSYVRQDELRAISDVIAVLNSEFGYETPLSFDIRPVDVNGEVLGVIKRVDGDYRWYPNGEEE